MEPVVYASVVGVAALMGVLLGYFLRGTPVRRRDYTDLKAFNKVQTALLKAGLSEEELSRAVNQMERAHIRFSSKV